MTAAVAKDALVAAANVVGGIGSGVSAAAKPVFGGAPFAGVLKDAIAETSKLEQSASSQVEGLLRGQGTDIHAAMIAAQKADISFEMMLAVRGKAVAAYQQVMGMQF